MSNLAVIPLRSESARIKNKNIKLVAGRPLFFYQTEYAKQSGCIDKIVVATDSEYYMDLAKEMGVDVMVRPKEVSGPDSKTEEVLLYVIKELEKEGEVFDNIIVLQATSPLNSPEYIKDGFQALEDEDIMSVLTYYEDKKFPLDDLELLSRPMTQQKKTREIETGCFWIVRVDEFKQEKNRIIRPYAKIKVSNLAAIDIDTLEDLCMIEPFLEKRMRALTQQYYVKRECVANFEDYYGPRLDCDGVLRDISTEMDKKVDFFKEEIAFINDFPLARIGNNSLLDLGCGAGYVLSAINSSWKKYGLEVSQKAADIARQYADYIHVGVLGKETYPEEFFDAVLCLHVIEHVPDPIELIENIKRILKTHGHLVIGIPNFDSCAARRFQDRYRLLFDETHISLFSDWGLRLLLEDHGFIVDRVEYPFFDTEYFTRENLLRMFDVEKVSPPFYGNIVTMYARKK